MKLFGPLFRLGFFDEGTRVAILFLDEITQNLAQPFFCQTFCITIAVGKSSPK
jgi:hypothetical protein